MLRAAKTCLQLYCGYLFCVQFATVLLASITECEEEKHIHISRYAFKYVFPLFYYSGNQVVDEECLSMKLHIYIVYM